MKFEHSNGWAGTSAKDPPRRAIVFVVGGTTYEEAPEHLDVLRIEIKERRPDFVNDTI